MLHDQPDDLQLLGDRLLLGIPLRGFDGRAIPLRDAAGQPVDPAEAALELLASAACLLTPEHEEELTAGALARARSVAIDAWGEGASRSGVTVRVTGVLVSAAVRASVLARDGTASPSELNRATLSWFEVSRLRRRELIEAGRLELDVRRSA